MLAREQIIRRAAESPRREASNCQAAHDTLRNGPASAKAAELCIYAMRHLSDTQQLEKFLLTACASMIRVFRLENALKTY